MTEHKFIGMILLLETASPRKPPPAAGAGEKVHSYLFQNVSLMRGDI